MGPTNASPKNSRNKVSAIVAARISATLSSKDQGKPRHHERVHRALLAKKLTVHVCAIDEKHELIGQLVGLAGPHLLCQHAGTVQFDLVSCGNCAGRVG